MPDVEELVRKFDVIIAFKKRQMKFTLVYLSHYYTISSKVRRKAGKYNMVATRFAHQIAEYFSPFLAKIK